MNNLDTLLQQQPARVQAVLNLLLESPYFYHTDDEEHFLFLRRHQREFAAFFESHFGWQLIADGKCARLYKETWYNKGVTPSQRDLFDFTRRDDCLAFMALLEFFEGKVEEESIGVEDPENLRFRFGDLLFFVRGRFVELFPEQIEAYSEEGVRRILRGVMPQLERYRFLVRLRPPKDEPVADDDTIYECLPALWHYSVQRLSRPLEGADTNTPA
jgi:hypothetical protein